MTVLVLLIYLVVVFGIAYFTSRHEGLSAYFLNNKKTGLRLMTFSTVATLVGGGATVGIISEIHATGISYGFALPIALLVGMLVLGLLAKKIKTYGDKYGAYTVVDFFAKRFDKKNQLLTAVLQIFLIIIRVAVHAIAFSSLASVLIDIPYSLALVIAAGFTIFYTALGGLKVDIITDFIQFRIMLIIFTLLAVLGYEHVGGISALVGQLPIGHLDLFAFGGVSRTVGSILIGGFVFLGNTTYRQRIFSAEDETVAKKSFFLSMPFLLLFSILIVFLGLVAAATISVGRSENTIFVLMKELLPSPLIGLGFAAIFATVMSSLDSLLIGGSTILYRALSEKGLMPVSRQILGARLVTGLFGVAGFLLAFLVPHIVDLSLLVSYLALIFVPPIIAGLTSQRTSSAASFYSILIPAILVFALFPVLKENTFVITTPLGVLLIIFYDKIFGTSRVITK